MKFKILPKIHHFGDAHGHTYVPGDIVDLPPSYLGETWLEPVDKIEDKKPEVKIESVAKESTVPLKTPKTRKNVKKKLKS